MSPLLYSLRDGTLRCEGRTVHLSRIQFRILTALLEARGGWVARGDLIYRTWVQFDEEEPDWADNALYTHVRRLRQKLEGTSVAIESGHGRGLRARINSRPEPEWGEHPYNIVADRDGRRTVWTPGTGPRCGPFGRAEAQ